MTNSNDLHKKSMQKQKQKVEAAVAKATKEQGVLIVLTGNGKGKSSSGFGTLIRTLGHGHKAGLVQFIKGQWKTGEIQILTELPNLEYIVMGSGFTWETQNRKLDQKAFNETWEKTKALLKDESIKTLMLDELTYMLAYKYLDWAELKAALNARPKMQNVIITGRGAPTVLRDLADTVTDMKMQKHAFKDGIKAQAGIEW